MPTPRKQLNNSDTLIGSETLFDFLKRKKICALHSSVKKNTFSHSPSNFEARSLKTSRIQNFQEKPTSRYSARKPSANLTPRKVSFADDTQFKTLNRSELSVSPMKQSQYKSQMKNSSLKNSRLVNLRNSRNQNPKPLKQNSKQPKKNTNGVSYHRKQLNDILRKIQEKFNSMIQTGNQLKNKNKSIFFSLSPYLDRCQKQLQKNQQKNFRNVRASLKQLPKMFQIFNCEDSLIPLKQNFLNHLHSLQQIMNSSQQQHELQTIQSYRSQQMAAYKQLEKQKLSILRENHNLKQRVGKLEEKVSKEKEDGQGHIQEYVGRVHRLQLEKTKIQDQYAEAMVFLEKEVQSLKLSNKQLQKQLKDAVLSKEEVVKQYNKVQLATLSEKQQYLLSEIQMLKQQYSVSLHNLQTLHSKKQQQSAKKILSLANQLQSTLAKTQTETHLNQSLLGSLQTTQKKLSHLELQNECLKTDLVRLNQQFYGHWVALKDIRVLSSRLGWFQCLQRIFFELKFNQSMFT